MTAPGLCRDCGTRLPPATTRRCGSCGSPRVVRHSELHDLAVAHVDCDAFYAAVEKRDNPALIDKPVIVGGRKRGVVATACYIARLYGVHSAMPMFQALAACPDAVVLQPDMAKYQKAGQEVRALMQATTVLVEPVSIDEAYLDLGELSPESDHSPAERLADLANIVEREVGISLSIGLSYNKSLAKLASDMDKPRGFAVIGRAEAVATLAPMPVARILGVGPALTRRLARDGINVIGQLASLPEQTLVGRYGSMGRRLYRFARGQDERAVAPRGERKSVSAETTLESNVGDLASLSDPLRRLCDRVAQRLRRGRHAASGVTLKLKTGDFRSITRSASLPAPTQRAQTLFESALHLLSRETDGTAYRLIGVGASRLTDAVQADPPDMLNEPEDFGELP